jgi:hypothetical protein
MPIYAVDPIIHRFKISPVIPGKSPVAEHQSRQLVESGTDRSKEPFLAWPEDAVPMNRSK